MSILSKKKKTEKENGEISVKIPYIIMYLVSVHVPSILFVFVFTVYLFEMATKQVLCIIIGQFVTSGSSIHFLLCLSLSCILWLLLLKKQSGFC